MSSTFFDKMKALRTAFKAQITDGGDGNGAVQTAWPNISFDPPSADTLWIQFTVRPADRDQVSSGDVGNNRVRSVGVVMVAIYAPKAAGEKTAHDAADRIIDFFATQPAHADGWRFRRARAQTAARNDQWWRLNVVVDYYFDETG